MNKRSKRKLLVIMVVMGVALATVLGLTAFEENMMYFYSPTEVNNGTAPDTRTIRVGGLVVEGTVERATESLLVKFDLTDGAEVVKLEYSGILPDLFREGQGIVAMGKLNDKRVFVANEVLAKHDENYMPPEVADALEAAEQEK
ncbi:MAG: cytochrome c maturation protein CcmE [Gammaproteobacteria bacterium]|nr:cytochrome c maturation protein CcmE [Gammaproteobacteria bacterium]